MPLNGAQLWMQTAGGSAHNKVCSSFIFKKCLGIQTDHIVPRLSDLQVLVHDVTMLQAKSLLDFQSSHSEESRNSWCQWKYSFDLSCRFEASWTCFFFLLIQVTQHEDMIIWAEWFLPAEKKRGFETFSLKQMSVQGKPLLSAPPCSSGIFSLSEQNLGKEIQHFYIIFPKKTLFLHRHLLMPDIINSFQNFRKRLKSTRNAKKLSLGMFYCFLRSGWPCTYCKW